jgi:hypothetical protein
MRAVSPAAERSGSAEKQTGLEHLEPVAAPGAEPECPPHVSDESRLVDSPGDQQGDGLELADLGGEMASLAQGALVQPVVALHELFAIGLLALRRGPLP